MIRTNPRAIDLRVIKASSPTGLLASLISARRSFVNLSDIDPDRQNDRRDPFPAELLLDGEGRLVVEDAVDESGPAEDGLAGEDRRLVELLGHGLADGRGRLDDIDARVEARFGREAQAPGQVDVFLERGLGRFAKG